MKINREAFLKALQFARLGLSTHGETIAQSNCFIFVEGSVVTFNDDIMTMGPSTLPEDVTSVVPAEDFLKVLDRMPDETIDLEISDEEIRVKGTRRSAGITVKAELLLPYDGVPRPAKWSKLSDGVMPLLRQAARTCGNDFSLELSTMVHVNKELVEACDNWRLFRAESKTGFRKEVLIPGQSILRLGSLDVSRVSVGEGWCHFKTAEKQVISIRCSHEPYHDQMEALLDMTGANDVKLPSNLDEIIARTVTMMSADDEPRIRVLLKGNKLTLESRKDAGWYKETKRVKYTGPEMEFDVNPKFLGEMLQRARSVTVLPGQRMKMEADGVQFVVALVKSA